MQEIERTRSGSQAVAHWTVLDFDRELAVEDSWDGLEAALREVPSRASTPNAIATIVAPSGETLSIGVAGPRDRDNPDLSQPLATIEYNRASLDPPYLVVVGDAALNFEDGGVVVFRFEGQWTEVLRRNCVPVERMLPIVHHFFDRGTLPDWVIWEQI